MLKLLNRRIYILAFCIVLSASAIAQNVSKDIEIGEAGLEMVKEQMGLYEFEPLEKLISGIGKKLVSQLETPLFKYEFYLVDSPEPNAFALPGGKIFVTRGLLVLPLTEDELAGVIGHEIIHSNNRHSIKQKNNGIFGAIIAIPGLILGGVIPGPVGQVAASPFLLGNQLLTSNYSRSHEKEADRLGVELAAKAGYQPLELAAILDRLKNEAEFLTGENEEKSYFSSHPYTPKRISLIEKNSKELSPSDLPHYVQTEDFLPQFNGLLTSENPKNGFIKEKVFYHPEHLYSFEVSDEWETAITPESFSLGSKESDALIALRVAKDSLTFGEYLETFEEDMEKQSGIKPDNKEKVDWFGYKGGMMEYVSNNGSEEVRFQIFAIDYKEDYVLKMATVFKKPGKAKVEDLLKKAKAIKKSELPKAEVTTLYVKSAFENETLEEMVSRTNASEFEDLIEIINSKTKANSFKKGNQVKILKKEQYSF